MAVVFMKIGPGDPPQSIFGLLEILWYFHWIVWPSFTF